MAIEMSYNARVWGTIKMTRNLKMRRPRGCWGLILIMLPTLAAANTFEWRDDNGNPACLELDARGNPVSAPLHWSKCGAPKYSWGTFDAIKENGDATPRCFLVAPDGHLIFGPDSDLRRRSSCSTSTTFIPQVKTPPTPPKCLNGFVPRKANPYDQVCVPPARAAQISADNAAAGSRMADNASCKSGTVFREAFPSDDVCVFPEERVQTALDNKNASMRLQSTFAWGVADWVANNGDKRILCYQLDANSNVLNGGNPFSDNAACATAGILPGHAPPILRACRAGLVHRLAFPFDETCVTPEAAARVRQENATALSRQGNKFDNKCDYSYTNRKAFEGDGVCVKPSSAELVAAENANAAKNFEPTTKEKEEAAKLAKQQREQKEAAERAKLADTQLMQAQTGALKETKKAVSLSNRYAAYALCGRIENGKLVSRPVYASGFSLGEASKKVRGLCKAPDKLFDGTTDSGKGLHEIEEHQISTLYSATVVNALSATKEEKHKKLQEKAKNELKHLKATSKARLVCAAVCGRLIDIDGLEGEVLTSESNESSGLKELHDRCKDGTIYVDVGYSKPRKREGENEAITSLVPELEPFRVCDASDSGLKQSLAELPKQKPACEQTKQTDIEYIAKLRSDIPALEEIIAEAKLGLAQYEKTDQAVTNKDKKKCDYAYGALMSARKKIAAAFDQLSDVSGVGKGLLPEISQVYDDYCYMMTFGNPRKGQIGIGSSREPGSSYERGQKVVSILSDILKLNEGHLDFARKAIARHDAKLASGGCSIDDAAPSKKLENVAIGGSAEPKSPTKKIAK